MTVVILVGKQSRNKAEDGENGGYEGRMPSPGWPGHHKSKQAVGCVCGWDEQNLINRPWGQVDVGYEGPAKLRNTLGSWTDGSAKS